jgi:hypothetical protein
VKVLVIDAQYIPGRHQPVTVAGLPRLTANNGGIGGVRLNARNGGDG